MKTLHTLSLSASLLMTLVGCGEAAQDSHTKEAWDARNNPHFMGSGYEVELSKLPSAGRIQADVWADDYWASRNGGTSFRWQTREISYPVGPMSQLSSDQIAKLSPAEKLDLYRNDGNWTLTLKERGRTRVLATVPGSPVYSPGFEIPGWEGLCHGWAPASLLYKEPKAVRMKNDQGTEIPFTSSDIKALLTLNIHTAAPVDKKLIGGRCEAAGSSDHISCRDANAASFHLILANEVGSRKKGFVVDLVASEQVWNHPVVAYSSKVHEPVTKASPGAAPGTVFEADVETELVYVTESSPHAEALGSGNKQFERVKHYRYVLELNGAKQIIGGRWLSQDHPDFIWRQAAPGLASTLSGLDRIYKAATGEDLPRASGVPAFGTVDNTWGVPPTSPASGGTPGTGTDWDF